MLLRLAVAARRLALLFAFTLALLAPTHACVLAPDEAEAQIVVQYGGKPPAALSSYALDFGTSAASYPGLTSTVTGTIYAQTDATHVAAMPASGWEYRPGGGGVWVSPSWTNLAPAAGLFDFRTSAGWTAASGTVAITTSAIVAPDGSFAQTLTQGTNSYTEINKAASPGATSTYSIWYKWDSVSPPTTQFPAFTRGTFVPGPAPPMQIPNAGSLARYAALNTSATTAVGITPAGSAANGSAQNADHGAGQAWGYSAVAGPHDVPLASGTASVTQTLDAAHSKAIVDSRGNLELRVDFNLSTAGASATQQGGSWNSEGTQFYLWSASTTDGLMAVRWAKATNIGQWILTVRGVDVLTVGDPVYLFSNTGTSTRVAADAQWSSVQAWYNVTSGTSGIRIGVNGAFDEDATGSTTGGALARPSTVYLGSNLGSATDAFVGRVRYVARPAGASHALLAPEGVIFGDSILSSFVFGTITLPPSSASIYSLAEAYSRAGIGTFARSGYQTPAETSLWSASPWKTATSIRWAVIQVGVNDLTNGNQTAAQTAARIQTLVNTFHADQSTAKIVVSQLTPCKTWLTVNFGASYYTRWQVLNTDIAGTGPNPITGIDGFILHDATSALNNGSDDLPTLYDTDGIHPNALGRSVLGGEFRTKLVSLGLLSVTGLPGDAAGALALLAGLALVSRRRAANDTECADRAA